MITTIFTGKNCKFRFFFACGGKFAALILICAVLMRYKMLPGQTIAPKAAQQTKNAELAPSGKVISPEPEYVDIRNGFRLMPPAGSMPSTHLPTKQLNLFNLSPWNNLDRWDMIRMPASKTLVYFSDYRSQYFSVTLLIMKKQCRIEDVLKSRVALWKKYPNQANLQQTQTTSINDHIASMLTLTWKEPNADKTTHIVREALIQNENDRYFLLDLVSPDGTVEDRTASDTLMKKTSASFFILSKNEVDRRWNQALQNSRDWLKQLKYKNMVQLIQPERWYLIRRYGRAEGFLQIQEKQIQSKSRNGLELDIKGKQLHMQDGLELMRILGWQDVESPANGARSPVSGVTSLTGTYFLARGLKKEEIIHKFIPLDKKHREKTEQISWKGTSIQISRNGTLTGREHYIKESLEVDPELYLPWTLGEFFGRENHKTPGKEYAFLAYHNCALGYNTYRIVSRNQKITIDGRTYLTTHIINQPGALGPIIQSWWDTTGRMVRLQSEGFLLDISKPQTLSQQLPQLFEDAAGEKSKATAPPKPAATPSRAVAPKK